MTQTKSNLSCVLDNIVKGDNNFCCLCLNIDKNIGIHQQITIESKGDETVALTDILLSVFGKEIQEYLLNFENICEACFKSVISIYTFIQTQRENMTFLTMALDGLNESVAYINEQVENSETLFLKLNCENFTSWHLFDTVKHVSRKAAITRFNLLMKPKVNKMEKKDDMKVVKTKDKSKPLKISDMLLNPNDNIFKCKICHKTYPNLWKLRVHFMKVHATKKHKCTKCSKRFATTNLLKHHMNEKHCEIICSECGKTFKNRSALARHEMGHNLKLVCPVCGRVYKNNMTYRNHICTQKCRANPADAQYTCDYCGKKYTQKMSLRVHIQYNHGNYKFHSCKWCDKKFWAQSRLKAHIVKHTREKNFICSVCQGKYVSKESLLYHTRLHTGEKPYKCSECEQSFISSSRRTYHMKTYHVQPLVQCDTCHSKFSSRHYLLKHMKSHDKNDINQLDSENLSINTHESKPKNKD